MRFLVHSSSSAKSDLSWQSSSCEKFSTQQKNQVCICQQTDENSKILSNKNQERKLLYSNLPNECTSMIYQILRKNLDQGSVIIFDQWKLFRLIDLIPKPLYEEKPGI